MQKFEFLRQPLLGELAMSWREERRREKEKKMPFIVATYVYASSQGQRTHSARTNLGSFPGLHILESHIADFYEISGEAVGMKEFFKNYEF